MALGVELVGIAYNLFLDGLREVVAAWQWQVPVVYVSDRNPGPCMTLTDTCMTLEALFAQHAGPYDAVPYIRFGAMTADARRVATHYTDVVKHGRLLYERAVCPELRMTTGYAQGPVGHLTAVGEQYVPKLIVG